MDVGPSHPLSVKYELRGSRCIWGPVFEDLTFHHLRHTHATLLLQQGVHVKVVQERLGHSSIEMIMDIYSHLTPDLQDEAAEKFEKATK